MFNSIHKSTYLFIILNKFLIHNNTLIICIYICIYIYIIVMYTKQKMDPTKSLYQKLHEINTNFTLKSNKYSQAPIDSLQSKLQMLKKKINQAIVKNKEEVCAVLADATALNEKIQINNKKYQEQANAQVQKLREIQDQFVNKMQLEILESKERQNCILVAFQEKAQLLRKQIQKQQKIRQTLFTQITATLQDDLPTILTQLTEQSTKFKQQYQHTQTQCSQLISQTENYVKQFTAEQQNNSNKAFQLIRDLTKKIKEEIQTEKSACQATHEELFSYVQENCGRLIQFST